MEADAGAQGRGFLACAHQFINRSGYFASDESLDHFPLLHFVPNTV